MSASLAVAIACSRPAMASEVLAALAADPDAGRLEVALAGAVDAVVVPDGLAVTLLRCDATHPNVRRNLAIAATVAPLVAMLDDDAAPAPGWVAAALAVDPTSTTVQTGPEVPWRTSETALLLHAVCGARVAEGTAAHLHQQEGSVAWTDVPFCNVVVPRHLLERTGLLPVEVPADMDDFAWLVTMRGVAAFRSVPQQVVRHDRYPDGVGELLRERWRLRRRTGEKLITHPGVYLRVPQAVAALAAPWVGVAVVVRRPRLAAAGAIAYGALVATALPPLRRHGGWQAVRRGLPLIPALHASTIVAINLGVARALAGRADDHTWHRADL